MRYGPKFNDLAASAKNNANDRPEKRSTLPLKNIAITKLSDRTSPRPMRECDRSSNPKLTRLTIHKAQRIRI